MVPHFVKIRDSKTGKISFGSSPPWCPVCGTKMRVESVWVSTKYLNVHYKCPNCGEETDAHLRIRSSTGRAECPKCGTRGILIKGRRLTKNVPCRFTFRCPKCGNEWTIEVDIMEYEVV